MKVLDLAGTARNLTKLMKEKKISAAQVAEKLDIHIQSVYKWKQGVSMPTLDNLVSLCEFLQVTLDNFIVTNTI